MSKLQAVVMVLLCTGLPLCIGIAARPMLLAQAQSSNLCAIANSATPIFDASACTVFSLSLDGSASVASSSLINAQPGSILIFMIKQDDIGKRPFVWPINVLQACAVSPTPLVITIVTAVVADGPTAISTGCTSTEQASLISGPVRAAPASPSDGLSCWFASVGGGSNLKCVDPLGSIRSAVLSGPDRDPSWFIRFIDPDGTPQMGRYSDYETPSGVIDGANRTFVLLHYPKPPTNLILVVNGAVQARGRNFNLSGGTISFVSPPPQGAVLTAWYRW